MEILNSSGKNSCLSYKKESSNSIIEDLNSGRIKWIDLRDKEKEIIVNYFAAKINYIVQRFLDRLPNSVDRDDLVSAGIIGLLEGLRSFDSTYNTKLETFVDFRIKGAILDELRKCDFFSRGFRKKIQIIEDIKNRSLQEGNKSPSLEELQKLTGFEKKELVKLLEASENTLWVSIEEIKENLLQRDGGLGDEPSEIVVKKELVGKLSQFIDDLKEKEKLVLSLYYEEELTMKEVAEVLNISEGRVSQLHKQAIQKLKRRLNSLIERV